jgi:hypothetical protein
MAIQQKNKPENLEERETRIKRVATYNRIALEAMTMNELRELGAFLIPNARKLKKPEFINALLEVSESFRQNKLRETIAALEVMGDKDISPEFISNCFLNGIPSNQVSKVFTDLCVADKHTDSTIAKTDSKRLRLMLEKVIITHPDSTNWCKEVYQEYRALISSIDNKTNKQYAKTVENYGTDETTRILDGKKILDWASDIIDWAYVQTDLIKGWQKVSLALAITSGRRMDEIHGNTQYELVNANTIRSIGLAKKEFEDYALESPCLVNAEKWITVINRLPESRRNQPNSTVNGTIRKAIEESIKLKTRPLFGIETYKDSRDFYISYLVTRDFPTSGYRSQLAYAKTIIGHEAKKQSLSYEKFIVTL